MGILGRGGSSIVAVDCEPGSRHLSEVGKAEALRTRVSRVVGRKGNHPLLPLLWIPEGFTPLRPSEAQAANRQPIDGSR